MRKGSVLILTIVVAVAVVGLALIFAGNIPSPTGAIPGGGGNIPLKLSGSILNCGICDGRLDFAREDGKAFGGSARSCTYTANVKTFQNADTQFDVSFKNGPFIETLVVPPPTTSELQVNLDCATPTPVPSDTPVPSETPTIVPTETPI